MEGFEPVHNDSIWLPSGQTYRIHELQAARAVEEYDASLILGQLNGQWTVFLRNGPTQGQPFPVLGLGHELPTPEVIKAKLYRADTQKHGGKIAQRVDRQNREAQKVLRAKADDAAGETAEYFDIAHRIKKTHPTPRIFVPGKE